MRALAPSLHPPMQEISLISGLWAKPAMPNLLLKVVYNIRNVNNLYIY